MAQVEGRKVPATRLTRLTVEAKPIRPPKWATGTMAPPNIQEMNPIITEEKAAGR